MAECDAGDPDVVDRGCLGAFNHEQLLHDGRDQLCRRLLPCTNCKVKRVLCLVQVPLASNIEEFLPVAFSMR